MYVWLVMIIGFGAIAAVAETTPFGKLGTVLSVIFVLAIFALSLGA